MTLERDTVPSRRHSDSLSGSGNSISSDSDSLSDSSISDVECNCPTRPTDVKSPYSTCPAPQFIPVLIIGAGPCGLAMASRLSEDRPAALYTDLEHARLSWLSREDKGRGRQRRKSVKGHWGARKLVDPAPTDLGKPGRDFLVVDNSGSKWLSKWDRYFDKLGIVNLRSPMFFHPSPSDTDGLLAYVQRMNKEGECAPINGVVGQELSKHAKKKLGVQSARRKPLINERDRTDYFRPSTVAFRDFCWDELETRYNLEAVVENSEVVSINYNPCHLTASTTSPRFTVEIRDSTGRTRVVESGAVVLATGPSSSLNFPPAILSFIEPGQGAVSGTAWCHSAAFAKAGFVFPPPALKKSPFICVIGGGLTSAQICDLAARSGARRVVLICRNGLKVKHFDFDLSWVTKYANLNKMAFFQEEDFTERFKIFREARNGGSVDPSFNKILLNHVKTGALELKSFTEIRHSAFNATQSQWTLEVETCVPGLSKTSETLEGIDYLVMSTGSTPNFHKIPYLQNLLASHPIDVTGGLPHLTEDLQWNKDVPLFVMGQYSALQLGPDAPNLAGTRSGAERICRRLTELNLLRTHKGEGRNRPQSNAKLRSGSEGNYFSGLEQEVE